MSDESRIRFECGQLVGVWLYQDHLAVSFARAWALLRTPDTDFG